MKHTEICNKIDHLIKKGRKHKLIMKVLPHILIISLICTIWGGLGMYQQSRYSDDYNCVGMSRDCEEFFERMSVKVWQVRGTLYNYSAMKNVTKVNENDVGFYTELAPSKISSHRWIILDFGSFRIPFESTYLIPFHCAYWYGYENLEISEGYYVDGQKVATETSELTFVPWNNR